MESAVTWGQVAGVGGLIVLAIIVVIVLLAVVGVFNDWSH